LTHRHNKHTAATTTTAFVIVTHHNINTNLNTTSVTVLTGTPDGVGPVFPGDVMEAEVVGVPGLQIRCRVEALNIS
jgi:2-keto-4-pentenoate hydratase/2-oxohepta-3-ene-1,7-dioic acid hydratase in catechol pathway